MTFFLLNYFFVHCNGWWLDFGAILCLICSFWCLGWYGKYQWKLAITNYLKQSGEGLEMYRFSIYLKKGAENPRGSNSNQPSHEILKHRRYAPGNSPQILHYETKSTIKSPSKKHAIFPPGNCSSLKINWITLRFRNRK